MKKNNRELKGLAKRGLAIVLCCLCLLATVPVSAMAQEAAPTAAQEETPAAGGEQMENPQGGTGEESPQPLTEEIPEGKTVPTTQNVTPITTETTTTPNTETTTTPNTETTTTPSTETTTTPNTETTSTPSTETTTTPNTETTTTPNTETTAPTIPVLKNPGMVTANLAAMPENDINLAAIGAQDSVTLKIGESATITSNVTDTSANSDHRESWVSDNEAVAKVDYSEGDDHKAASATVTGVSAGTATITHTYYTYRNYGYTRWTTHTETIQVTVSAPEYTVTFYVGADAEAAGVPAPEPVTVTEGQTISDLPEPVWKTADGQFVMVFAGWYSDEALTTEFTSETPVTADTALYAKWVEPEAEGVYYVNFYSQDGQTVHLTLSAMAGKTVVAPADVPTLVDKVFKGWSTTMQGDSPAANLDAFDFTTPVSDAATNGTLNLYAWYAQSVTVNFIANGGTAVPSQIIAEGDTATSGQTTREGYTFRGWSTDKEDYTAFDFDTRVNEDLTLYAFWDADLVPVTIVYMYEHANDAEYSPAGKSVKVYAPAGSYVSIEKSTINNLNGSHAVRYADTIDGALNGYAKQSANANAGNATIPDISDTYYQYDHATNKRWVNPAGTTTVLVYYNRARVTLTFAYTSDYVKGLIDYTNLISQDNRTKYQVNYSQSGNNFNYSFTAKYGEDITAVWPQVAWVKDSSGNTPSSGNSSFYGWKKPSKTTQVTNMYTLESDLFGENEGDGLTIENGVLVGKNTLPDVFSEVTEKWAIYARTTLPGETVDFVYGGKNYTIYTEACQMLMSGGDLGYKELDGCTPISGKTRLYDYYPNPNNPKDSLSISNLSANGSTIKEKFDTVFAEEVKNGKLSSGDFCQVLLYDRNNLTLSVWTNADNISASDPHTSSYLYGDKIYNEDTDLLKSLEKDMTKAGYVFAGWYTASEFTPGTEYKPDENSTITANMNLYAKWEPNQFRAEYYLYMDDATPYAWQGFAEGGKIDDKLVPSAVQDSFLGWYWYQNGQLVRFDFTSAVGANHVDKNSVLKLYAKWSGKNGKVSYLPGIGGDNTNQEVVDGRDFAINEASVQLPQYTSVWSSGVPTNTSLTFVGWKAPNGVIYQPGRYVLVTRNLMQFEAQWSKDAVKLIYNANGGNGDDVTENWARNSVVSIWDNMDGTTPHFTREGYTLLGWDENKAATTPTYKLGQGSITLENEVTTLYAIWEKNTVTLTIKKTVSGNMYNANDEFKFNINFGESTKVFTLKANAETTFEVPVNANVTVIETDRKGYTEVTVNDDETSDSLNVVKPENSDSFTFMMPDEDATLVINNDKTVKVDTGVSLETLPYILILGVVAVGVVLMVRRRRHGYDD